jgi:hypothetical protein
MPGEIFAWLDLMITMSWWLVVRYGVDIHHSTSNSCWRYLVGDDIDPAQGSQVKANTKGYHDAISTAGDRQGIRLNRTEQEKFLGIGSTKPLVTSSRSPLYMPTCYHPERPFKRLSSELLRYLEIVTSLKCLEKQGKAYRRASRGPVLRKAEFFDMRVVIGSRLMIFNCATMHLLRMYVYNSGSLRGQRTLDGARWFSLI